MKIIKTIGALVAITAIASGCNDITNPVEQQGQLVGPYVRWAAHTDVGTPEGTVLAVIQMPTRVEEDVTIHYTFGGDAVYGQDFYAVDASGNERTDVTATGGTATIHYDPGQTAFGRDTVRLYVPFDATNGRTIDVQLADAQTASGQTVEPGYIEDYQHLLVSIKGYMDIPEGTWNAQRAGDVGNASGSVTVSKPAGGIQVDGSTYVYEISDYTAVGDLFGAAIPWSFSVFADGTVLAAPSSHVYNVTSDVTGNYDSGTQTLTLDVTLTCCGGEGLTWTLSMTPQ